MGQGDLFHQIRHMGSLRQPRSLRTSAGPGYCKNRFREINVVPSGAPTSSRLFSCPPSI